MSDLSYESIHIWQRQFIERFLREQNPRSLLVAPPGTGRHLIAMFTAARLLEMDAVDCVLVISRMKELRDQWVYSGSKMNLDFQTYPTKGQLLKKGCYSSTMRQVSGVQLQNLTAVADGLRLFIIVDEIHEKNFRNETAEVMIKLNPATKILEITGSVSLNVDTYDQKYDVGTEFILPESIITLPENKIEIVKSFPSYDILEKMLKRGVTLDDLHWREFEKLVSELLEKDGYTVQLMEGTKDGGVDVIATKDMGGVFGNFQTIWQAKKKLVGNKVGLSLIRELADTRNQFKASKAFLVTTSFFTAGAVERIEREKHLLGKVDRNELLKWIQTILRGQ